jgi:YegS/Rv2252/BmrU family lipid kinase
MSQDRSPRTLVVVNPASAAGATRRRWDRIARALQRTLGPFEHAFTDAPRHATTLTRGALEAGFEMVVAVGGDGTLNEVAGGFFRGRRPVAPRAALGVIPYGTGCDFARTLGASTLEEACARLAGRRTRSIDVGHACFVGDEGQPTERVFLNVASFGCSGRVAHVVGRETKRVGGALAFALAAVRVLATYRDQPVTVTLDGEAPRELAITNGAVCNGRYFGGGMQVAPQAEVDDRLLDVTIWSGFGLLDFVWKRRTLYDGTHVREPGTRRFRAGTVSASSAADVLFELDGEGVGRLPVSVQILPAALRLKG